MYHVRDLDEVVRINKLIQPDFSFVTQLFESIVQRRVWNRLELDFIYTLCVKKFQILSNNCGGYMPIEETWAAFKVVMRSFLMEANARGKFFLELWEQSITTNWILLELHHLLWRQMRNAIRKRFLSSSWATWRKRRRNTKDMILICTEMWTIPPRKYQREKISTT